MAPVALRINPRHQYPGALPYSLPQGHRVAVREQSGNEPGYSHHGFMATMAAAEPEDMLALCPCYLYGQIVAYRKEPRVRATLVQCQGGYIQLDATVLYIAQKGLHQCEAIVSGDFYAGL